MNNRMRIFNFLFVLYNFCDYTCRGSLPGVDSNSVGVNTGMHLTEHEIWELTHE